MLKKVENGLNVFSIISWVITIILLVVIQFLGANNMLIKLTWNDVSRFCDTESMVMMLNRVIYFTIVLAGATNLISTIIRKIESMEKEES